MSQRDLVLSIDKSESWVGQVEREVLPLDSLATAGSTTLRVLDSSARHRRDHPALLPAREGPGLSW